jgi:1-acyl-sn-glycerol-3-phosphate acyltransferase
MLLARLRARHPGAPLWRVLWWCLLHFICYLFVSAVYRYRSWGAAEIPGDGPVLFVSNHQSFLDPILVGVAAHHRQFYAMARSTLWRNPALAWLINSLNGVPVERNSADVKAMRRCLEVLDAGQALLLFPEGTRTPDGRTRAFSSGLMLLIKRARPKVVPVAIEGAFDAWPRNRKRPRLGGRIGVMYGPPIDAYRLLAMPAPQALETLRGQIEAMRLEVARRLAR